MKINLFAAVTLAIAMMLPSAALAKKNDEKIVPEYQVEGAGTTSGNSRLVRVYILSKKKDVTDEQLGTCAVHAVLFRDIDDLAGSGFGSTSSHKAIMQSPSAEAQHIDFFEPFFRNGDCNKYVQVVSDSRRVVKTGKQYKTSAEVRVNTTQLKKDLKTQGMVKDLGSGW